MNFVNKIKKRIRKTHFIILNITSVLIFVSFLTSSIERARQNALDLNNSKTDNYIQFSFKENINDNEIMEKVLNKIKKQDNIILRQLYGIQFDPGMMPEGIYFNGEFLNGYEILEGRFFNKGDFIKDEKLVVIGKGLLDKSIIENGKRYILRGLDKYEVIGVIGKKEYKTRYDILVFYNLNSVLNKNNILSPNGWTIDSTTKSEEQLKNLIKEINSSYIEPIIQIKSKSPKTSPFIDAVKSSQFIEKNFILIIGCISLSLIKAILHWIDSIKIEIGIRKICGATNKEILIEITKRYIIISILSIIISLLIQKILLLLKVITILNYKFTYRNIISSIMFVLIIGVIFINVTMSKLNKCEPNVFLKGN